MFCRDCVVDVNVERRGSSAPEEAEGCIVVRLPLLRLPLRASAGFSEDSDPVGVCCPEAPLTMLVNKPGPTDFRGGFAADAAGTGPVVVGL